MSWKDQGQRAKGQGMPKLQFVNAGRRFAHWRLGIHWSFVLCYWPFALLLLTACSPPDTPDTRSLDSKLFSHAQVIGERGGGAGQFNKPRSVGLDGDDNIFVIDITGRVQKFSPTGEFLLSWQMPETDKGKAKGMDTDPDGNVLLIEPHYMRVNHFAPDGRLLHQWGREGTNTGQLIFPRAVAVAPDGGIWVSEYAFAERIQKFSADGATCLLSLGGPGRGPGEFNRAEGIGVDAAGNLHVADSCNHRIQVFSADGRFLRAYGRPGNQPGEMSYPFDIRIDNAGRQYVCEFGNSRIQVFDREDRLIEVIGGPGRAPGQFSNPWSIALDSQGNLIVADSQNHRVQKLWRRPLRAEARDPKVEDRSKFQVRKASLDGASRMSHFIDVTNSAKTI
jgi:sugar lactone lactonase YvrE